MLKFKELKARDECIRKKTIFSSINNMKEKNIKFIKTIKYLTAVCIQTSKNV